MKNKTQAIIGLMNSEYRYCARLLSALDARGLSDSPVVKKIYSLLVELLTNYKTQVLAESEYPDINSAISQLLYYHEIVIPQLNALSLELYEFNDVRLNEFINTYLFYADTAEKYLKIMQQSNSEKWSH